MTTHPSLRSQWRHSGAVLLRMWATGWKVIGKTLLASLILSAAGTLGGFAYQFLRLLPDTEWAVTVHLVCALLGLMVFLPLAFYVAASWVGFCPYVDRNEADDDA